MNNVAGICLKGRYINKMPMYSRSAKIICILKGSSVQSMKNLVPPLRLGSSYMMTLNPPNLPTSLLIQISKIEKLCQGTIFSFFLPPVLPGKTLSQVIHLFSGQTHTTSPLTHQEKAFILYILQQSNRLLGKSNRAQSAVYHKRC